MPALAQEADATAPAAKADAKTDAKAKDNTPVDILANEMEILDKDKKAVFRGAVDATKGTTNITELRKVNDARVLGMNIIEAKDHGEAFAMVEAGKADAFATTSDDRQGPSHLRNALTSNGAMSISGVRPDITSTSAALEPHDIVQPMWPWPVL